tara:strand:- start:1416 stop:1646 length:231 start_codon:yes stop_codon:yes gene_type:complete
MIKLHPETADAIMDAFDSYGRWSNMSDDESGENQLYAIRRKAEAVMVLVNLGLPHFLKDWAEEILSDTFFTDADYK